MVDTGGGKQGHSFRRDFTDAERRAFRAGRKILWFEDRKWHTGTVTAGPTRDVTGTEYITIMNTDHATRNVDDGETTRAYPGSVKKA